MNIDYTLFFVSILFIFILILSLKKRDYLNPILIFSSVFFIQYLLYYIYYSNEYVISDKTNSLFLINLVSFISGYMIITLLRKKKKITHDNELINKIITTKRLLNFKKIINVFIYFGVFGFFLGIIYSLIYGNIGSENFFFNLRFANTQAGLKMGIAPHLLLVLHLSVLYSIFLMNTKYAIKKKNLLILVLLLYSSAFFTMARTSLLIYSISLIGVYMLSNRYTFKNKINYKYVAYFSLAFISLSIFVSVLTFKNDGEYNFFISYLGYPIVSFDKYALNYGGVTNGTRTFSMFFSIFSLFGVGSINALELPFKLTNGDFNVFTYILTPYLDFGTIGVILLPFFLGIIYGFIYIKVKLGNPYWIIGYSILLYPLIMVFYDYQFNLTSLLYYFLLLVLTLYYGNSKKKFVLYKKTFNTNPK